MQKERISQTHLKQELQLIRAAQRDPRRFSPLYDKYHRQIFLFVFKRIGEEAPAADVTSQVFLKAMLALKKYTYKGVPFSAWLYRIASNEVNQFFRSQKAQRTVSMERDQIERMVDAADNSTDPDYYETHLGIVLETIKELKPEEVELLELRFFEQRPFREVAYIMGITENNAKVRMHRILERLKKKLNEKLGGAGHEA